MSSLPSSMPMMPGVIPRRAFHRRNSDIRNAA
jgi:hypothetical protein